MAVGKGNYLLGRFLVVFPILAGAVFSLSRTATPAALKELPQFTITGTYQSITDSLNPEASSATFTQTFRLGPFRRERIILGHTAAMQLNYEARNEIYDFQKGSGGTARDTFSAFYGFQDASARMQAKIEIEDRATFRPSVGLKTGADFTSRRSFILAQALSGNSLLTAQATHTTTGPGASRQLSATDGFSGSYTFTTRLPSMNFSLLRTVGETRVFPFQENPTSSSSENTNLLWDFRRESPIGNVSAKYEFNETVLSQLGRLEKPSVGIIQNLNLGLDKRINPSFTVKGQVGRKWVSSSTAPSTQTERQKLDVDYSLPTTRIGSAALSVSVDSTQDTGGGKNVASKTVSYQMNLKPSSKVNLDARAESREQSDISLRQLQKKYSSSIANVSFVPHERFKLAAQVQRANEEDFRDIAGGRRNTLAYGFSSAMTAKRKMSLSLSLFNVSEENVSLRVFSPVLERDILDAIADLRYSPLPNLTLTGSYKTSTRHSSTGERTIGSTLKVEASFVITDKITWVFSFFGEGFDDRDNPFLNSEKNTLTSVFTIKF